MTKLQTEQADRMADLTVEKKRARGFAPLTQAVLDAGSPVVVLKRDKGASVLRPGFATAKAWGTLGMGLCSRELARRAQRAPAFLDGLETISDACLASMAGSAHLPPEGGDLLEALGVSSETSDNARRVSSLPCALRVSSGTRASWSDAQPGSVLPLRDAVLFVRQRVRAVEHGSSRCGPSRSR